MSKNKPTYEELERRCKRAEEMLQRSQQIAHLGTWELDLATNRLNWSDEVYRIFGLPPQEFPATYEAFLDAVHPEDREAVDAAYRTSVENKSAGYEIEHRIVKRDTGEIRVVHEKCEHQRDRSGLITRSIGMVQDITKHKQAELALRQSEHRFRSFVENAGEIVYSLSPEGIFTYISPNWLEFIGEPAEEAIGRSFEPYVHPEDVHLCVEFLKKVVNTGQKQTSVEYRVRHADGSWCWHTSTGTPIRDDKGNVTAYVGIAQDITERKAAEQALRESEEKYRILVENSGEAIFVASDGMLKYANSRTTEMTGFTEEELKSKPFVEFIHPDDRQVVSERHRRRLQSEEVPNRYAFRVVHSSGETRWVEICAAPIQWEGNPATLNFLTDITERKKAEEALRETTLQLEAAIRAGNVGLWDWDLATNKVFYSAEWKNQIGYEEHEIGDDFEEWESRVHPEDLKATLEEVQNCIAKRETDYEVEFRFCHKEGHYVWILAKASVVCNDSGEPVRVLGSHVNITERKRAEESLRESEREKALILNSTSEMVAYYDLNLRVQWANRAAGESVGKTAEQLAGMYCYEIWHGRNEPCFDCPVIKARDYKKPHQAEATTPDGRQWLLRGYPVIDDSGEVVSLVEFGLDITSSKKAEEELKHRENLLQKIFDILPVGLWFADKNGKLLRGNPKGIEIWGAEPHVAPEDYGVFKARRLPSGEEIAPDDWALAHTIREGATIVDELLEIETFNGEKRMILNYTAPVLDDNGEILGAVVVNQDVTDSRRAEAALRHSEEKFSLAFRTSPYAITITRAEDGKIIEVNDAFSEITGYSREEAIGNTTLALQLWDKEEDRKHVISELLSGEELVSREYLFRKKNGELVVGLFSAQVVQLEDENCILSSINDITERKAAEADRERLLLAIEQAAEIIVITDPEGIIQYVNPAFEKTTGYSREEAAGQNPRILKSGKQDVSFYKEMWDTISSGKSWEGRMVNKKKDGSLYTEEATISPVCDKAGSIINYVAVKRDITRELALEQQYRQSQKMEAIGQLTGGVAHDFNNLLQVIGGGTEMALIDLEEDHPAQESLKEVVQASERAARLVGQLLAFSRRQIMRPETLDPNETINELLSLLRRVIGEHIRLEWIPGRNLGSIYADRGMIEQALMNLCVNARDAMPDGGTLTIETQRVLFDSEYCENHSWAVPGRYVLLSVSDTGCGMDKETLDRVFEPFFTTKETGKGTGLGLSTVYGIIRQHEGMINAYSEPGKGSTFKVYLPVSERKASTVGSLIEGEVKGGKETILVAEDDEAVRNLAVKILKRAGYEVLTANDGFEAVEVFNSNRESINLALMDVVMPGIGGHEAYKRMQQLCPDLKVLFASGYSENAVHTNFVIEQGLELLQKPYSSDSLLRAVREILDR